MAGSYLLAIDAGTSGCRAVIADFKGGILSVATEEWTYDTPPGIAPLGREFHPAAFWGTICANVRQAMRAAGIAAGGLAGISATSQREGAVFLDRSGRELYGGPNIDLRAINEGLAIEGESGTEVYRITGHKPAFLFVPARLKWFQANRPDIFERISTVLSISDWIIYRLCGERVSEPCAAGELGLANIAGRDWSAELRALIGLPEGIYPPLVAPGSRVGGVSSAASRQTGLEKGLSVAQGAPDAQCGILGLGVKNEGQAGFLAGWSAPLQMSLDKFILDTQARTWSGCHPLPGRWVLESSLGEAGNAYRWLKDTFYAESKGSGAYDEMDRLAGAAPPGAGGALGFIGPQALDMSHVGIRYGGFLFPLPTSVTGIGRGHLVRACLENIAFALKTSLTRLETISGRRINDLRAGGGMVRSRTLCSLMPSVLGMPVRISQVPEVSALGAAMCAAAGAGVYSSLEEAAGAMAAPLEIFRPEPVDAAEYEDYFRLWQCAASSLENLGGDLS